MERGAGARSENPDDRWRRTDDGKRRMEHRARSKTPEVRGRRSAKYQTTEGRGRMTARGREAGKLGGLEAGKQEGQEARQRSEGGGGKGVSVFN